MPEGEETSEPTALQTGLRTRRARPVHTGAWRRLLGGHIQTRRRVGVTRCLEPWQILRAPWRDWTIVLTVRDVGPWWKRPYRPA